MQTLNFDKIFHSKIAETLNSGTQILQLSSGNTKLLQEIPQQSSENPQLTDSSTELPILEASSGIYQLLLCVVVKSSEFLQFWKNF